MLSVAGNRLTVSSCRAEIEGCVGVTSGMPFGQDALQLLFYHRFLRLARDRQLLDHQIARSVEHAALAEGQRLGALEAGEVPEDLGHLEQRAGFDLLHE